MRFSIRVKFLFVMSGLLFVCLGFYLLMSITVFKTDKTQLVYDLNRSQVSNLASEIETSLAGLSDTLALFAQLPVSLQEKMIDNIFSKDSDIVSLSIYKQGQPAPLRKYQRKEYFETYGVTEKVIDQLSESASIPLNDITQNGEAIWNGSIKGAPPLIGYGKRVLVVDEQNRPIDQWVLVTFVKLDSFLKSVSILNLSEIQISNQKGEILVQRDAQALVNRPNISKNPLFKKAMASNVALSVTHINIENKGWLSAYAKAFNDQLIVTAKAPEEKVFQVVRSLTVRTLLFGSIVLTLVILAAFLLSRSLTANIAKLAHRMTSVSEGDLSTQIHLKGKDETVSLGNAFNKMIFDLRQSRDELEVMNRELDQKVKDRTQQLEIQNRKVVEAQEALLRTTRLASMGEVAGRTAHEVLNPLTSLLTRAGLTQKRVEVNYQKPLELLGEIGEAWDKDYQEGGFDNLIKNWQAPSSVSPDKNLFLEDVENISRIRENLQQQAGEISRDMKFIREEGDRIGKIVHSMRRLGNMKSSVREQSIHKLLQDCFHIMADLFEQQRVDLIKDFQAGQDSVMLDSDEFIQAVTNLMRNSLQSLVEIKRSQGRQASLHFKISTYLVGTQIFIDLEDNGFGIEAQYQDQLFKANFTTKSSDEGTGLGLSISRRFIRSYDGDIEFVESIRNEKTVFRIKLPIAETSRKGKAVA